MRRHLARIVISAALVGAGWTLARARQSQPDFEIAVSAPAGQTTVTCVRGCSLAWSERGLNPNATPTASFQFSCTSAGGRCLSGKVAGWLAR